MMLMGLVPRWVRLATPVDPSAQYYNTSMQVVAEPPVNIPDFAPQLAPDKKESSDKAN